MAQPSYVPASLHELSLLSDEIWYLAGDSSVDTSWYTKRASLGVIYSSTEVFMTTDKSPNFIETENFLDRRFEELKNFGETFGAVSEWVGVSGKSLINVLRSKGVRV
jgi:ubiquinone biosynthesis protein COQ9